MRNYISLEKDTIDDVDKQLEALTEFKKTKHWTKLLTQVCDNSEDNPSLSHYYKISKNVYLAYKVFNKHLECKRYFSFDSTLTKINETNITVLIEELNVYCIFQNISVFQTFAVDVYDSIYLDMGFNPAPEGTTFNPYQIVLSNQKQKIIFFASGVAGDINLLKNKCENYFKKNVRIINDGKCDVITVDLELNNLFETACEFKRFKDLLQVSEVNLARNIELREPDDIIHNNYRYMLYNIANSGAWKGVYDAETILKYLPTGCVNNIVFFNTTIGDNNNIGDYIAANNTLTNSNLAQGDIIITKPGRDKKSRDEYARNWVKNNPPTSGDRTKVYYGLYANSVGDTTPINTAEFGAMVESYGFHKIKSGAYHKWIKNVQ
jgi:hypothetical protein